MAAGLRRVQFIMVGKAGELRGEEALRKQMDRQTDRQTHSVLSMFLPSHSIQDPGTWRGVTVILNPAKLKKSRLTTIPE